MRYLDSVPSVGTDTASRHISTRQKTFLRGLSTHGGTACDLFETDPIAKSKCWQGMSLRTTVILKLHISSSSVFSFDTPVLMVWLRRKNPPKHLVVVREMEFGF